MKNRNNPTQTQRKNHAIPDFYDSVSDPNETTNLYESGDYIAVKEGLSGQLAAGWRAAM